MSVHLRSTEGATSTGTVPTHWVASSVDLANLAMWKMVSLGASSLTPVQPGPTTVSVWNTVPTLQRESFTASVLWPMLATVGSVARTQIWMEFPTQS